MDIGSSSEPRPQNRGSNGGARRVDCIQGNEEADEDSDSSSSCTGSSSSCLSISEDNGELSLDQFREMWKEEINHKKRTTHDDGPPQLVLAAPRTFVDSSRPTEAVVVSRSSLAIRLYREASRLETAGLPVEATEHYRQAFKLEPDLDLAGLMARADKKRAGRIEAGRRMSESSASSVVTKDHQEEGSEYDDYLHNCRDLTQRFSTIQRLQSDYRLCRPNVENDQSLHLSDLPPEVMVYIVKWIVGSHLDLRSLDQLGLVCRGFYLLSRDDEIWRTVCLAIWGDQWNNPASGNFASWREMALTRPHLAFNGCYLSCATYVRYGEPTLGGSYRPCFLVEHYRALRFLPHNRLLYLTSPEAPSTLVKQLENSPGQRSAPGLMQGRFQLDGNTVTCLLYRRCDDKPDKTTKRGRRMIPPSQGETIQFTYRIVFKIKASPGTSYHKLTWTSYSVSTQYRSTSEESVTEFDLTSDKFPPMRFSRVASYTAQADVAPLS